MNETPTPVRALYVPTERALPCRVVTVEQDWQATSHDYLDGGYLEMFGVPGWHGYCDEDGKGKGLPVNSRATVLAYAAGWQRSRDVLVGPVLFLGPGDEYGNETDVPDSLLHHAGSLGLVSAGGA